MNCEEFVRSLPDRWLSLSGEHERHAAGCPNCSTLAGNRLKLAEGCRALARDWERLVPPPRVEAKLLAAFRGKAGIPAPPPARPWAPALTWASAAAATVAMALYLVGGHSPQPRPAGRSTGSRVQLALAPAPDAVDPETGEAEGFIPLPNAPQILADEDVNIVRLEVPRSSMIALGYPVSDGPASQEIEADVVLGTDGLARAVRFVDE
jgi:hypothetical protein